MALSTGDRRQIYTRLAPVIGEQEAEMLLDQFPSGADAPLVTTSDLAGTDHRIATAELRLDAKIDDVETRLTARIDGVETRLDAKIDDLETRLTARIDGVETRLDARIDGVETRLDARIDVLHSDMAAGFARLETTFQKALRTQTILMFTAIVAVLGLVARTNLFG